MRTASPIRFKLAAFAAFFTLFCNSSLFAQDGQKVAQPNNVVHADSVVLLVTGHIKSGETRVYRSTIDVRDTAGNLIATSFSYSGSFTIKVPVAFPKQPLMIEVHTNGYKPAYMDNYVWSYGSILEFEMDRSLFGTPSRGVCFRTVGCPNF
jgi:hypothetical protein